MARNDLLQGFEAGTRLAQPIAGAMSRKAELEGRLILQKELMDRQVAKEKEMARFRAELDARSARGRLADALAERGLQELRAEQIPAGRAIPFTFEEQLASVNADRASAGLPAMSMNDFAQLGGAPMDMASTVSMSGRGKTRVSSGGRTQATAIELGDKIKEGAQVVKMAKELKELDYDPAPILEGYAQSVGLELRKAPSDVEKALAKKRLEKIAQSQENVAELEKKIKTGGKYWGWDWAFGGGILPNREKALEGEKAYLASLLGEKYQQPMSEPPASVPVNGAPQSLLHGQSPVAPQSYPMTLGRGNPTTDQLPPQYQATLAWAYNNPDHPEARQVLQRFGHGGGVHGF